MQPINKYLKSKLFVECKEYKRLQEIGLEEMHKRNPKGYMDFVKSYCSNISNFMD